MPKRYQSQPSKAPSGLILEVLIVKYKSPFIGASGDILNQFSANFAFRVMRHDSFENHQTDDMLSSSTFESATLFHADTFSKHPVLWERSNLDSVGA